MLMCTHQNIVHGLPESTAHLAAHQPMTLPAACRVVMRGISGNGGRYSRERFLEDYVTFMTTPGSHNDTYAESFHRDFFANFAKGTAPENCSKGTEGHNTASIGGFVVRAALLPSCTCAVLCCVLRGLPPPPHPLLPRSIALCGIRQEWRSEPTQLSALVLASVHAVHA